MASFPRNPDGTPRPFNDPFQPWAQLQNDGGHTVVGRSNNCADCTRSFMEAWYGNPQVSAPRTYDPDGKGGIDRNSGERNGTANIQQYAGTEFRNSGPNSKDGYARIADELRQAGHGAAAAVLVTWPKKPNGDPGGAHVFNAVNHNGRVIWVDSQTGTVSEQPINTSAENVWHLVLDADRKPFDPATAQTQTPQQQSPQPQPQNQQQQSQAQQQAQAQQNQQHAQAQQQAQAQQYAQAQAQAQQQQAQHAQAQQPHPYAQHQPGPYNPQPHQQQSSNTQQPNPYQQPHQQQHQPGPQTQPDQQHPYAQQQPNPYQQPAPQQPNPYAQQQSPYAQQPQPNPYTQQPPQPAPQQQPYSQAPHHPHHPAAAPDTTAGSSPTPDTEHPDTEHPDTQHPDDRHETQPIDTTPHPDGTGRSSHPEENAEGDATPAAPQSDPTTTDQADHAEHHDQNPPSDTTDPAAPTNDSENSDNSGNSDQTNPTPTPTSDTRNRERPGGLDGPTDEHQQHVEDSIPKDENGAPQRHPDPDDGNWVGSINDPGPDAPGRSNNCVDAALAAADTYSGNPTAAAHRTPDTNPDGAPSDRGERNGRDRIENTLGARFSDYGNGRDAFNRLEDDLRNSGHGSQAVIVTQDSKGRAHAWNVVNHNGKITYVDAQTGQRSNKPLHDGTNGVHAIPLNANRRPLTPDSGPLAAGSPSGRHNGTDPQASAPSAGDRRRPPSEPAGAPPERFDPEAVRGSAEFGERQKVDHTQYKMPLEDSQGTLRVTHDVSQIDLGPVLDNAHRWARDGSLARVVAEAQANGAISQRRLNALLKGFQGLNDEQKMAVVAGIARISTGYHEAHAAGNSPVKEDPGRRRPQAVADDANPLPGVSMHENHEIKRLKEGEDKPEPASLAREYAVAHEAGSTDKAAIDATHDTLDSLLEQNKNNGMRPDMSGKNYAVIEVHETGEDGKTEVSYVIDSSIPGGKRYHHDHSEPHLGEWMRAVEAKHPGKYKVVSLFTEFEPCGDRTGTGGANCSDYLSNDMDRKPDEARSRKKAARTERDKNREGPIPERDLRISYGIGYRKGAMGFEEAAAQGEYATAAERREAIKEGKAQDNAERDRVKKMTDSDMVKYRGEWLRIWMSAVTPTQSAQSPGTTGTTGTTDTTGTTGTTGTTV